jgi:hypothetical protein
MSLIDKIDNILGNYHINRTKKKIKNSLKFESIENIKDQELLIKTINTLYSHIYSQRYLNNLEEILQMSILTIPDKYTSINKRKNESYDSYFCYKFSQDNFYLFHERKSEIKSMGDIQSYYKLFDTIKLKYLDSNKNEQSFEILYIQRQANDFLKILESNSPSEYELLRIYEQVKFEKDDTELLKIKPYFIKINNKEHKY